MKMLWIALWIGIMNIMSAMGLATGWVLGLGIAGIVIELIVAVIKAIVDNV